MFSLSLFHLLFTIVFSVWAWPALAAPPVPTISSPSTGTDFAYQEFVVFTGSATDDVDLPGDLTYEWLSSRNGSFGDGTFVNTDQLLRGTHQITLSVTDNDSETGTARITVYVRDIPVAAITSPADNGIYDEGASITFTGTGTDSGTPADDGALAGSALVWESDRDGQLGTGLTFARNDLSRGTHQVTLTVTDSDGDTDAAVISIRVGNTLPVATISSPADNSQHTSGDVIVFSGSATDTEDGAISGGNLAWSSSLDGALGTGATLALDDLSSGTHVITLTATDSQGATGTDDIVITIVNTPPTAIIYLPEPDSVFSDGETIQFFGAGSDAEDDAGDLTLSWSSNRDGVIGTATTFSRNDLSAGTHTVTLTVTDTQGATGTDAVTLTSGNTAPTAVISAPADGSTMDQGDTVTFYGTGSDTQDGELLGAALSWTSTLNGVVRLLGTGNQVTKDDLAGGTHVITLTATDSNDQSATATITLTVTAMAQLALTPASLSVTMGSSETAVISGGEGPYRAFVDNPHVAVPQLIGTTLTVNGISAGQAVVTITDNQQRQVSADVTVSGSAIPGTAAPTVYAGEDQIAVEGQTVTLDGTRSFDTDNAISAYQWQQLTGTTVTLADASDARTTFVAPAVGTAGTSLSFRLTITDATGLTATDDVGITVNDNGITDFPSYITSTIATTQEPIGFQLSSGAALTRLDPISTATFTGTINMPVNFVYGIWDMELQVSGSGDTAVITIYLPEAAPPGYKWYKYSDTTGWIDFDRSILSGGTGDGAVFDNTRTRITLYLTDNGDYDADTADQIIRDPSGLAAPPQTAAADDDSGCFLRHILSALR